MTKKKDSPVDQGIVFLRQKKYKLAEEIFNKALHSNPKNVDTRLNLGHTYLQQKNYSKAIEEFNKLLRLDFQNPHAHEGLALVYLEQDRLSLCKEKLDLLKKLGHKDAHYYQIRGYVNKKEKRYKLAIKDFLRVLELDPGSEFANENLIQAYHESGGVYLDEKNYSKALDHCKRALELCPKSIDALAIIYINMGRAHLLLKEYALAIESFKKALDIKPDDRVIIDFLSRSYLEMKKYDLAVDSIFKSYNLCPDSESFFKERGTVKHKERIKLVRIPNFYDPEILSTEMNSIMLLPLALGTIASHIRSKGISINQDDLHIKTHYDNYFGKEEERIDSSIFFDIPRIVRYTNGNPDLGIEEAMKRISLKTEFSGYDIVLFSLDSCSMNDSHVMLVLCLARYLKKKYNPIIILGGVNYFVDLMRKIECDRSDINYIIGNEGEVIVAELLVSLIRHTPYKGTGLIKEKGVIFSTKVPRPIKPDFDGLPLDRYRYRGLKTHYCNTVSLKSVLKRFNESGVFLLPFRFIKGCTNRCIFCASSLGGLIHVIPPLVVVDWLEEAQARYSPTGYLFLNDTLNISRKYVNEVCDEIIRRNLKIRWSDCARVDRLDRESIYKMRKAGCIRLVFGMETASKKLLNYINKDIDLEYLEKVLRWTDEAGIWTGIELICGIPYETEEDCDQTISFLKKNEKRIDSLYYNAFNMKATSLMQRYPEKYGIANVFELASYEDGFSTFVQYGFDEANGLKWPEKVRQIVSALHKTVETFGESPFPEHEYEHFLFFLYSNYPDKKVIKKLFCSVGKEKMEYLNALRRTKNSRGQDKRFIDRTLIYG
ncbi:tetratricopeptide repeat protein [Candidatus Omnitrophota bacterium]